MLSFSDRPHLHITVKNFYVIVTVPMRSPRGNSGHNGAVADGAVCEAWLKLQEAGKALVLTESPTLYFSCANLHCEGLGADSVTSWITTVM